MRKAYIVPAVYLVFAGLVWVDFLHLHHRSGIDPLQSIGVIFAVLPLALVDIAVAAGFAHGDVISSWAGLFHELGLPAGYVLDTGYYYAPRVAVIAFSLWFWLRPRGD